MLDEGYFVEYIKSEDEKEPVVKEILEEDNNKDSPSQSQSPLGIRMREDL